jgi:ketosteroid isomerase-like protein
MRRLLLVIVILPITWLPLVFGQTNSGTAAQNTSVEQEILRLERERLKAFAQADKAAFEQLVTDDLTITHGYGEVLTKAQEMSVMRPSTSERPLPALSIEDPKVRIYGDAAVMTGSLVETNRDGRREFLLRFTNTYVKQKDQWRMVAGQLTTLSRERLIAKVDPKIYGAYVGQYRNPRGRILAVLREGDKLMIEVGGQKAEIFPESETQFFFKEDDVLLVFVIDEQGRVVRLVNRRPNGDVVQEVKIK